MVIELSGLRPSFVVGQPLNLNVRPQGLRVIDQINKLIPLLRIFFPEQRKWVARVFILFGLPLVVGKAWEPYANALLQRYFDIRIPVEAATYTGWVLIAIGLFVFAVNEVLDRLPKPTQTSSESVADRQSLNALFREIHIPSIDTFVHYGTLSMSYYPALHYFAGIEGFVQSSSFHFHDAALKSAVEELHESLGEALDYGEFFHSTSNPDLYKFDSRQDIHANTSAKAAHDGFISAVYRTKTAMRTLCSLSRSKFPDFDFEATDKLALKNYRAYQSIPEV